MAGAAAAHRARAHSLPAEDDDGAAAAAAIRIRRRVVRRERAQKDFWAAAAAAVQDSSRIRLFRLRRRLLGELPHLARRRRLMRQQEIMLRLANCI